MIFDNILTNSNHFIYHGSDKSFECPTLQYSVRSKEGIVVWEGHAVFASQDKRIAVFYTYNKDVAGYSCAVDLIKKVSSQQSLAITLLYDESINNPTEMEALNKLYGTGEEEDNRSEGYLYKMDIKFFTHEAELGEMEKISRHSEQEGFLIQKEKINKRKMIDYYIKQGLITINLIPLEKLIIRPLSLPT